MFIKFPSIENDYNVKVLQKWLLYNPQLANAVIVVLEKIHGANVQLMFSPGKEIGVASRRQQITETDPFYGIWDVLPRYARLLDVFKSMADNLNCDVNLYGELFGFQQNIQYGEEPSIRFFAMRIAGELCSFSDLEDIFQAHALDTEQLVPVLGKFIGLVAALEFDTKIPTKIVVGSATERFGKNPDNLIEGVVLAPYLEVIRHGSGSFCMVKMKNDWAVERKNRTKKKFSKLPPEAERLRHIFSEYITEMRVVSVVTKAGGLNSDKDIGPMIVKILQDAREDFLKEYGEAFDSLDPNHHKFVTNVGAFAAPILKRMLREGR